MMTSDPIGCGATPSAVIQSFPAIPPRPRAAALFRQGADNLDAFDAADPARVAEAIRANGAAINELRRQVGELEVAEALLAASVNCALTARERGAIQPLAPAEMASLRAYLDKVAGREEIAG